MVSADESFENGVATPAYADSRIFLLRGDGSEEEWENVRETGTQPQFLSDLDDTEELRQEFMVGAKMMGLNTKRKPLHSQQLLVADVLNANARFTGVLLPRRSAKTTSIFAWVLGRCASREEYLIGYTVATTGKKARDRFNKDIVPVLERLFPDPATRPFKITRAAGQERVTFDNGSIFQILKPSGEDFRSDAYDVVIIDEAGEADPAMGADILEAALPTQDTRPEPMIVFAGTAADYRVGNLLWDELVEGRVDTEDHAIIEYGAGELITAEDLADWPIIEEIVLRVHPGIGTLTTLKAVKTNWERLKPAQFSAEYLGVFGLVGAVGNLLNQDAWTAAGEETMPTLPDKFALVIAAHPDQLSAAIGAVWRDDDGKAMFALLEHRHGVDWLAGTAAEIAQKYGVPIIHDNRGVVMVETEQLQRMRPRPQLLPQTTKNVTTAAGLLVKEVELGNIRHFNQPALTLAAQTVTKRKILGSWGLGRPSEGDDITPIECMALGLRVFDEGGLSRPKLTIIV